MKRVTKTCVECRKKYGCDSAMNDSNVFCPSCADNACAHCRIVLSHRFECRCGRRHGAYADGSKYCADCKSKNKK